MNNDKWAAETSSGSEFQILRSKADTFAGHVGVAPGESLWLYARRDRQSDGQTGDYQTDALRLSLAL